MVEKSHSEELHNLQSTQYIIRVIKLKRVRWAVHLARMVENCIQGFDGET
jgi:hypothetical protein